jgi:manganese transport protein
LVSPTVLPSGSFLRFLGPAALIGLGFIDPGNWSTAIEAGSRFGFSLVWVLVLCNPIAVAFQMLSVKAALATGRDLAQLCRGAYPHRGVRTVLWLLAEVAIIATDMAEVVGTAVGFQLLTGLPLRFGVLFTALDTLLFLLVLRMGMRKLEALVGAIFLLVFLCLAVEMALVAPPVSRILGGMLPTVPSGSMVVITGIVGAVVMPHNIFLHSRLALSRGVSLAAGSPLEEVRSALKFNLFDSLISLEAAFLVNLAIMLVAAQAFFSPSSSSSSSAQEGLSIQDAHRLIAGAVGSKAAPVLFAVALLASGQSSTVSGTMCGETVMSGFVRIKAKPWLRRLITRSLAILPALVVVMVAGESAATLLLVISQVVLSIQLPFTLGPLLRITSSKRIMSSDFVNTGPQTALLSACCGLILSFNIALLNLSLPLLLSLPLIAIITAFFIAIARMKINEDLDPNDIANEATQEEEIPLGEVVEEV